RVSSRRLFQYWNNVDSETAESRFAGRNGNCLSEALTDLIHFGPRARHRNARLKTSDDAPGIVKSSRDEVVLSPHQRRRLPEFGRFCRKVESSGHHADNLRRLAIDLDRLSENAVCTRVPALPEVIVEHGQPFPPDFFFSRESPAKDRHHCKQRKHVRG